MSEMSSGSAASVDVRGFDAAVPYDMPITYDGGWLVATMGVG